MTLRKTLTRRYKKDVAEEKLLRALKELQDSLRGNMNPVMCNILREIAKSVGSRSGKTFF